MLAVAAHDMAEQTHFSCVMERYRETRCDFTNLRFSRDWRDDIV
jgi:hypothetical protein